MNPESVFHKICTGLEAVTHSLSCVNIRSATLFLPCREISVSCIWCLFYNC